MVDYVTPTEREKIRAERRRYVDMIAEHVKRLGFVEVSLTWTMDDPPRHFIEEFALMVHEIETRGHAPEPPGTLQGDLAKLCRENNWEYIMPPQHYGSIVQILAPMRPQECQTCRGRGRIYEDVKCDFGTPLDPGGMVVKCAVCSDCEGRGSIMSRNGGGGVRNGLFRVVWILSGPLTMAFIAFDFILDWIFQIERKPGDLFYGFREWVWKSYWLSLRVGKFSTVDIAE